MLISFKKDKAFINILSDLELLLSEVVDKLDMRVNRLNTISLVDNTRKYQNWNKIETVDTSNYIKIERYDIEVINKTRIDLPWRMYDPTKDLDIKVFLDGKLLNLSRDYVISPITDTSVILAGYCIDFGPYLTNHGVALLTGNVSISRFTTKLPPNVIGTDILIDRYDRSITGTGQHNHAIPWGTVTEADLYIEIYVNGELWTKSLTAGAGTKTYKIFSNYIYFNTQVTSFSVVRHHKIVD
jgi:hypothetical protein